MYIIARALAQQPAVLLLDEPIANLDMNHQMKVMKLLQQLASEGLIVVITIHDINMAARFCNKALMLKHGGVFASGCRSVYTPENVENLYDMQVECQYITKMEFALFRNDKYLDLRFNNDIK